MKEKKFNKFNYVDVNKYPIDLILSLFGKEAHKIMAIDHNIWIKHKFNNGLQCKKKWNLYLQELNKAIKNELNPFLYIVFEEYNYHSLNKALEELNKFDNIKLYKKVLDEYVVINESSDTKIIKFDGKFYCIDEINEELYNIENEQDKLSYDFNFEQIQQMNQKDIKKVKKIMEW